MAGLSNACQEREGVIRSLARLERSRVTTRWSLSGTRPGERSKGTASAAQAVHVHLRLVGATRHLASKSPILTESLGYQLGLSPQLFI